MGEQDVGSLVRRCAVACLGVLVASTLVVLAPFATAPASAAELLADGGFENATGNPLNSPSWTEADSRRSTPLCSTSTCSSVSPRSGTKWLAFGGSPSTAPHTASVRQSVTIPTGGTAVLTYYYANPYGTSGGATVQVQVDGKALKTHTESATAQATYTQQTVNLSSYANGASHTIAFVYANNSSSGTKVMSIDDVSLTYTAAVTARPTVSSVSPASPNPSTTPVVKGSAETGSTVTLYATSSCTGTALGSGTAAAFAGSGITVTVPRDATTTIYAKAGKSGQSDSPCSTTSVAYTSDATAPALVTLTSVSPSSPGQSTAPVVKGTAEAGSTVRLYTTSSCTGTPAASGTAAAFGSTGFSVTVAAGSTTTFRATATDAAGNTSACSTSTLTYTQDSSAPSGVTLTSVTPGSPGKSTTPVVKGTAEAGSTVRLYTTSGCTGTAAATGTAAVFASSGLTVTVAANATTTIRATATDGAGNVSACSSSSITYVNDSVAPATVQLTSVTPASPTPSTSPVVRGTAEAGSTVRLWSTANCSGTPVATGDAAAFAAPGLTATVALGSTTAFRATATDAAGNVSTCSAALSYTADLADGGFEAGATGNPAESPSWTATDSLVGSPLVNDTMYTPGAEAAPHTGKAWVWFGGFADAGHTGSISQTTVLPAGGLVALTFWYRNSDVDPPYDAELLVEVDGVVVRTITEANAPESTYSKQVVDLSAFADGGTHTLSMAYTNYVDGGGPTNMLVDDLALSPVAGSRAAAPTVTGVSPATGTTLTPALRGQAAAGSRVFVYADAACQGAPLARGTADAFAGGGITVPVPAGATTLWAKAVAPGVDDSACSTTSATYRSVGAPDTTLTKAPGAKVKSRKKKAKVTFAFTSSTPGATFQCSVDGKGWAACTSGTTVKLKAGKHTFAVRAVAAGLTDPTPATWTGKVRRKRR
jgi:hypothetical protein